MAGDVFKFVDSIASSPTVRLDMNDGVTWLLSGPSVDFSPPPLRRAINGTLLTDGSVQSASSYDNRLLRFTLELATATTDATATQLQLLNRELDRDSNYLMWQPSGATSPVFFRTIRTPVTQVQVISPLNTSEAVHVEVLAEPFALGLREDISIGTVNNDPAAGSNGLFFDVTGVKGDVAAEAIIQDAGGLRAFGVLGCRQHGTPANLVPTGQCESMTLGTDTTNPGGGPDAAMSGTGTNNFVRTSFGTATLVTRLTWSIGSTLGQRVALRGTHRLFACVRRSDAVSVIKVQAQNVVTLAATSLVTVPATTSRQLLDMGLVTFGTIANPGRYGAEVSTSNQLAIRAERDSGAGTIDWDFMLLVPADEQLLLWDTKISTDDNNDGIIDAGLEQIYNDDIGSASIFAGSTVTALDVGVAASGGFPKLNPNITNRFVIAWGTSPSAGAAAPAIAHDKTKTGTITVSYWPRYLYARPATT